MSIYPFHLAIPVDDLPLMRHFYGTIMECPEGRSATRWVDFDFFGHQLVLHLRSPDPKGSKMIPPVENRVDGHQVPVPHFGVVLPWEEWEQLGEKLTTLNVPFIIKPYTRFKGEVGEQGTMFVRDPEGNALEFKTFKDITQLFAK